MYYHKANPIHRESILKLGLSPSIGESYLLHYRNKETEMMGHVIFASMEVNNIYDSTYDDDVWAIKNPDKYTWHEDPSMKYPFVYTKNRIPADDIILVYVGTGINTF